MDGFYKKKDVIRNLLTTEKIMFRPRHLILGRRKWQGFLSCTLLLLFMGDGEVP